MPWMMSAICLACFGAPVLLQLTLRDIPGAFVAPAIVPMVALGIAKAETQWRWGLLPIAAASAGYFVGRALEGSLFESYAFIADAMAVGAHLMVAALYPACWWLADAWVGRRRARRLRERTPCVF